MDVTEHKYESNILAQEKRVQTKSQFIILHFENKQWGRTYIEGIEEYEKRNLDHADLHSNATAHLKAAN